MRTRLSSGLAVLFVVAVSLALITCRDDVPTAPPSGPAPAPSDPDVTSAADEILVGAGNIARCDGSRDNATALLLDGIPGTVFTAGDNIHASGSPADYTDCYEPNWGQHKDRTRPAAGNTDYLTGDASGYFGYFDTAAGDPGSGYYSYELGAWHIIVLNSNISTAAGSPQEQWLRTDLASTTKQCVLAYWHHPRFSSYGTAVRSSVKPLWNALYAAGADVIVNAHYRVYERFAPQTPDEVADPVNGIRQFTVGTGGQGVHTFSAGDERPNSEVRQSGVYGVLKFTLSSDSYAWEFVPVAGQTSTERGSSPCTTRESVSSVDVSPSSATVQTSSAILLTATPKDANGNSLSDRPVTWSSSDTTVATVNSYRLVTGLVAGSVTITARSEGLTGSSSVTVTTAPVSPAILVGAGDIASCDLTGDNLTADLLDRLPGTVFTAGDNAYPNASSANYTNCYAPTWGRHKDRTRPSAGNHEYETSGAAGYFGYFGDRAGRSGEGYYSYEVGQWQVLVLNSNLSMAPSSAQGLWLKAQLATSSKLCTLAYWHHPLFTSSGQTSRDPAVRELWEQLYAAGVELVINGHQHHYERFAPQTPDSAPDATYGIRQIVVGTGGRTPMYTFGTTAVNSQVRSRTRGVLKLTLSPDSYAWAFVPVAGSTFQDSGTGSCHGPPPSPEPVPEPILGEVFIGAGNIASCSNNRDEATAKLLDEVAGTVFTLGDNAFPNGSTADYANCYHPTWGRHKDRTYAVLGNHEYNTSGAEPSFDYFGDRAGPRGKGYFSFDLGDWHIIVLNDNIAFGAGSEQDQWLRADLAASTKQCTLAMWHYPRFYSSTGSSTSIGSRKILWDVLYAADADLVLNAQPHRYERFAPQNPSGQRDDARGIREFIVGTGGESISAATNIAPNSEVVSASFGVLKLTLGLNRYTWEFIPIPGYTFRDSGSGTCH